MVKVNFYFADPIPTANFYKLKPKCLFMKVNT